MKTLRLINKAESVILEYRNLELLSKDERTAKMKFVVDPEYSIDPEHPDYIVFTVFSDGLVNKHDFEWCPEKECYTEEGYTTWQVLEEEGA